ncbi:MAG: hypothetical protein ACREM8_13210 [Vulcanimicrobiaceae bacterium]
MNDSLPHAAGPRPGDDRPDSNRPNGDAGRTLLVGLIGGVASAVGYVIYSRLPDEQRERLHGQVRTVVESRINEIRSNLNI